MGPLIPCCGFLVTSSLLFKARMDSSVAWLFLFFFDTLVRQGSDWNFRSHIFTISSKKNGNCNASVILLVTSYAKPLELWPRFLNVQGKELSWKLRVSKIWIISKITIIIRLYCFGRGWSDVTNATFKLHEWEEIKQVNGPFSDSNCAVHHAPFY